MLGTLASSSDVSEELEPVSVFRLPFLKGFAMSSVKYFFRCLPVGFRAELIKALSEPLASSSDRFQLCFQRDNWNVGRRFRNIRSALRALRKELEPCYILWHGTILARNFTLPPARVTLNRRSSGSSSSDASVQPLASSSDVPALPTFPTLASEFKTVSDTLETLSADDTRWPALYNRYNVLLASSSDVPANWTDSGKALQFEDGSQCQLDVIGDNVFITLEPVSSSSDASVPAVPALPLSGHYADSGLQKHSVGDSYPLAVSFAGTFAQRRAYVWN
jgi:hypothetical protein